MSTIKKLLTDKSFWAAVIALVTSVLISLNVPHGSVEQITAIIAAAGTFIAYIVGNSIQAAAQIKADAQVKTAQIALQARTSESSLLTAHVCDCKQGQTDPHADMDATKEDK